MNTSQPNNKWTRLLLIFLASIGSLAILAIIGLISLVGYTVNSISDGVKSLSLTSSMAQTKHYTSPKTSSSYIAGIKLNGEINSTLANEILDKLEMAEEDKNAVGVLLEVNSPGGTVVASQEMHDAIKQLKEVKPVVVYVRDVAASGAYYSIAGANKIIAERGSLIGSIGVVLSLFEMDKLFEYLKLKPVTIKTGALKDAGSSMRSLNEHDKKYLQKLIDDTHSQFVADVKESRQQITKETLDYMADGRVVIAKEAVKHKLIDNLGTKKDALAELQKLSKSTIMPELFYYEKIVPFSDTFIEKLSQSMSSALSKTMAQTIQKIQQDNSGLLLK